MNKFIISFIVGIFVSCASRPDDALLHPAPNKSALESLPDHLKYLESVSNDGNQHEVIKKALQLLKQTGWPTGYDKSLQNLCKDVNITDSVTLTNLITYYQSADNQYMMRWYARRSTDYGYTSSYTLHALSSGFFIDTQLDSAQLYIMKALKKNPSFDSWLLKAQIDHALEDTLSAINSYMEAKALTPLNTTDIIALMELLNGQGRDQESLTLGSQQLLADSTSVDLILHLARTNTKLGNTLGATNLLYRLPLSSPERFRELVSIFDHEKRYLDIIDLSDSVQQFKSFENDILLAKARAFDKKWYLKSAIQTFEYLLKKDTSNQVVKEELEKVKGKATYLRRIKEMDSNINVNAQ